MSWEMHVGAIPNRMCVLHKCDNRGCVNPDHLFLGTHRDNAIDREAKGRGGAAKTPIASHARGARHGSKTHPERILRGEAHPQSKLTDDNRGAIRDMLRNGATQREVAEVFGVSQQTIWRIAKAARLT